MTSTQVPWRKVLACSGLAVAAVVVVAALVYVVFWPLSDLIARHDVGSITGAHRAPALQAARDAARGRLVALGAGLFAAGALVYTARNFSLARQGQVTDRYTKAIEQLGADKDLEVRIGGIYALERITRDSPPDHPTIMEVLAAFIRQHSREQWPPAEDGADATKRTTRPDVQAAATVIARRTVEHDSQPINLESVNLTGARLTGARLAGARLADADLTRADLKEADLADADLTNADLTDADLFHADLTRAHLAGADLTRAELTVARLPGADLTVATLTGASLKGADLKEADLTSVSFTGTRVTRTYHLIGTLLGPPIGSTADLFAADLTGARVTDVDFTSANLTSVAWSPDEAAPEGWQRDADTGRLQRVAGDSGGAAEE